MLHSNVLRVQFIRTIIGHLYYKRLKMQVPKGLHLRTVQMQVLIYL
jgi:hypothetical protein